MNRLLHLLILFIINLNCFSQTKTPGVLTNVSVSVFKDLMDSLEGEVVVDLRTPEELKQGKIPDAIVIDYFGAEFEPSIQALDRNKVYLIYCAAGGRSEETADLMLKWGFKKIYNLTEGFTGWVKQKMPVTAK
jgi:phage shock protein E